MSLKDISEYFTEDTLNQIIQKCGGTKVTSYNILSGFNKKGDSYLSQTHRLKVFGLNEATGIPIEVNAFVKVMSKNPNTRKLFRANDFFKNEIIFYTKYIPIIEKFQNDRNPKKPFNEYPKFLASHCDGKNDFIVLEDVNVFGFKAPDRQNCVDLEHCELIMTALGRFHGISLALKDQHPELFEEVANSLNECYYSEKNRKWYAPFLKQAKLVAIDAVSREYSGSVYEEKTKKFLGDELYDTLINITSAKTPYSVITHGDCWRPNFLMKYEEEHPKETLIIDFQLACASTPVTDITLFLYSCTDSDVRDKNLERILKAYHTGASEMIEDLGSNPKQVFPYEALIFELKQYGKFGCGFAIESIPLTLMSDDDVGDIEGVNSENAVLTDVWKIGPIKDKEGRLRIANCFKHAIDCGYIE